MRLVALERHRTRTLLGVRFWDRLTNRVVAEGLRVTAQRLSSDRSQRLGKPVVGRVTPSGAIAFFGLTAAEAPAITDPELWDSQPPDQLVAVDMVDPQGRFLPLSFVAQLPLRGVFRGQGDWLGTSLLRPELPQDQALGVQLWSAASRPLPPGRAVLRAQLVVGAGDMPAAYALMRVRLVTPGPGPAFNHYGLADARGTLVLPMPYPAVPEPASAETPYPPLDQQVFALRITVQYGLTQTRLPDSEVPSLEALLNQPRADIGWRWTGGGSPNLQTRANITANLRFEEPLVLGTALSPGANAVMESVLRLVPI